MSAVRALVASLLVSVLAIGCYGNTAPGPTPGSMDDVIANIVLQDVTVLNLTSGDAGCQTQTLHDNAVHATVAIGAQSASHEVYILNWRNQTKFDAAAADFAMCLDEIRAANPGSVVTEVDLYPWRAYGPGWTPQLRQIIENALLASGGVYGLELQDQNGPLTSGEPVSALPFFRSLRAFLASSS